MRERYELKTFMSTLSLQADWSSLSIWYEVENDAPTRYITNKFRSNRNTQPRKYYIKQFEYEDDMRYWIEKTLQEWNK